MTTEDLIQPHYIVRHEESTGNEIDAMNRKRRETVKRDSDFASRFLSTIYINEDHIPKYRETMRKRILRNQ